MKLRLPRCLILAIFCQMVQMFMSYDGGATPACLDKIQNSGVYWSQAELGLLGSLDKFGMTISSVLWGRALQLLPAKICLVMGLGVNAASTFAFGNVRVKGAMFLAKFLMGMTQGLQCVWSTCWVLNHAPINSRTVWLGLGAISAGVGNGIGTAVAGFGTSQGLPYAFAWQVEAAALGVLWLLLVLCPGESLAIEMTEMDHVGEVKTVSGTINESPVALDERHEVPDTPLSGSLPARFSGGSAFDEALFHFQKERSLSGSLDNYPQESRQHNIIRTAECYGEVCFRRTRATTNFAYDTAVVVQTDAVLQLRELAQNRLYMWTALVLSSIMFVTSGIQFMWVRLFMDAWGIGKSLAVSGLLLSTGLGGALGVLLGPRAIDRCGGFMDCEGRCKSLMFIACMMSASMCGALVGIAVLCAKWHFGSYGHTSGYNDPLLMIIWGAIFVIFAGFNASLAGVTGINIGAVSTNMRSVGSGCTVSVQNLLGYSMGPLLPGFVMDGLAPHVRWSAADPSGSSRLLSCGLVCVLTGVAAALGCSLAALAAARKSKAINFGVDGKPLI